jgi:hypothetical protein
VVGMLRQAARDAMRDGTPRGGGLMARARDRRAARGARSRGRASRARRGGAARGTRGRGVRGAGAERHLAEAVELSSDPRATALAALDWGDALWAGHRYVDAVRAFESGIAAVGDIDSELALPPPARSRSTATRRSLRRSPSRGRSR